MMTIIDALVAEHAAFSAVFDQIERALPRLTTVAEVKLLGGLVEGLLRDHADAEVNLAYDALDHMLEHHGQLDHLYQDHKEIDARFSRVRQAADLDRARALLQSAITASRAHFTREEQTVFRLVAKQMRPETLAELGRAWAQERRPMAEPLLSGLVPANDAVEARPAVLA